MVQEKVRYGKHYERANEIFQRLKALHHDATIELNYSSPLELLIATILSAQCTDVKVNEVTAVLFKRFSSPKDYVNKPLEELEELVRPTGFFRQKAKNVRNAVKIILEQHGGQVPQTMEDLVKLPGVGRKTANVVLGNAFNLPGLPVDTHVRRISQRLGLTKHEDPVEIERDLCQLVRQEEWCLFSHTLIFHGRRVCSARKPACDRCPITDLCPHYQQQEHA